MATRLKGVDEHSKVFSEKVIPVTIPRNFLEKSLTSLIDPNSSTIYSKVMENTVTSTENLQNIRRNASKICVELIRRRRYIRTKKDCLGCKCRERKRKQEKGIEKIPS